MSFSNTEASSSSKASALDSEQMPLLTGSPSSSKSLMQNGDAASSKSPKRTSLQSSSSNARPAYPQGYRVPNNRLGPQRTSYTTQKLKLLPDEPFPEDQESGREVYSQVTRIKDTPARKDAERLGKAHRAVLPRVTAYCTASSYRMKDLARYLAGRKGHKASPKLFDECLYTTYTYKRSSQRSPTEESHAGLMRLDDEGGEIDVEMTGRSDVFLFEYGVVVYWGFTEEEEKRFLKELAKFENEKLSDEDVQVEEFNYYITKSYQPRVSAIFYTGNR